MRSLQIVVLLSIAASLIGCNSEISAPTAADPSHESQQSNATTPLPKAEVASPKLNTVASILFNECDAPETLEGWRIVDEIDQPLDCQCAWPVGKKLTEFGLYSGRGDEPVFSFGAGPRDEDFSLDQILTATKTATTIGMKVTESKELDVGKGIRCLAYAGENRSDRQLFRIYATESQVWVISASYPKKNNLHPSLNYFFTNFKVNVSEEN